MIMRGTLDSDSDSEIRGKSRVSPSEEWLGKPAPMERCRGPALARGGHVMSLTGSCDLDWNSQVDVYLPTVPEANSLEGKSAHQRSHFNDGELNNHVPMEVAELMFFLGGKGRLHRGV